MESVLGNAPHFDCLVVVLVAARNPLNIGAAARAMSNFGVKRLRVVNPYAIAFREARSAVGATDVLANAEEFGSVAEAVADCSFVVGTTAATNRNLQQRAVLLRDGVCEVRERLRCGSVALLFGSEKRGLSNDDMSHCNLLVSIPTREGHRSMNLGQAVAVCLYELAQGKGGGRSQHAENANASDLERITAGLVEVLLAAGYLNDATPSATHNIRRLVRRLTIQSDDVGTILGMLRQIGWKIRNANDRLEDSQCK